MPAADRSAHAVSLSRHSHRRRSDRHHLHEGIGRLHPAAAHAVTAIAYATAFYFLSLTLKTIPTGVAYAIWSGVGIVLISLAAWMFQGQKLDAAAVAGMTLIVSGVVVMNLFSKSATH